MMTSWNLSNAGTLEDGSWGIGAAVMAAMDARTTTSAVNNLFTAHLLGNDDGRRFMLPHQWAPYALRLTPYASRLTPYASRLTPHALRLTPHASRLTPYALRPCHA